MSFDQQHDKAGFAPGLLATLLVAAMAISTGVTPAFAQSSDKVPRVLLENMARSQYAVLCGSTEFTACMEFTETACQELAEAAIKQCLLPLPDEISPEELDNDAVESCPKKVFEDAGFTEEQAGLCFDRAMESE